MHKASSRVVPHVKILNRLVWCKPWGGRMSWYIFEEPSTIWNVRGLVQRRLALSLAKSKDHKLKGFEDVSQWDKIRLVRLFLPPHEKPHLDEDVKAGSSQQVLFDVDHLAIRVHSVHVEENGWRLAPSSVLTPCRVISDALSNSGAWLSLNNQ